MLTSSSAASVVTSASTPARSGTGTRTSHSWSGRADASGQVATGELRALEHGQQRVAVGLVHRGAHVAEPGDEAVEHVDDRRAVLGADVGPDAGMTGGDPGHVAEAAGREPQQRPVLLGSLVGEVHQRRRGEVRHVRHHRDERVVALGRQRDDVGAERGHDGSDGRERGVVGRGRRREHPHRAFEQVGVGAVDALPAPSPPSGARRRTGASRRRR